MRLRAGLAASTIQLFGLPLHLHCNLCPTSTRTSTKPATLTFPSATTFSPLTACPPRVELETISSTPVTRVFSSFASMGTGLKGRWSSLALLPVHKGLIKITRLVNYIKS
ncbi:hypothetical protein H257_11783 [Aphanomyces astaci]|uniref:Secreted protein n=1 Tax=Aphanomyces astaci TaxID=112090 RepID=W4G0L5_APHAT|nr:hypothetical protein H257_11783 [Aphanomyces astaci]ETV73235.1 hypothetical protein H257_11783 [Aphanomyces astaci]|eukprot:XP_009837110.1 hypothetical protein H257_11783 [Aphanomyces astaci]